MKRKGNSLRVPGPTPASTLEVQSENSCPDVGFWAPDADDVFKLAEHALAAAAYAQFEVPSQTDSWSSVIRGIFS